MGLGSGHLDTAVHRDHRRDDWMGLGPRDQKDLRKECSRTERCAAVPNAADLHANRGGILDAILDAIPAGIRGVTRFLGWRELRARHERWVGRRGRRTRRESRRFHSILMVALSARAWGVLPGLRGLRPVRGGGGVCGVPHRHRNWTWIRLKPSKRFWASVRKLVMDVWCEVARMSRAIWNRQRKQEPL